MFSVISKGKKMNSSLQQCSTRLEWWSASNMRICSEMEQLVDSFHLSGHRSGFGSVLVLVKWNSLKAVSNPGSTACQSKHAGKSHARKSTSASLFFLPWCPACANGNESVYLWVWLWLIRTYRRHTCVVDVLPPKWSLTVGYMRIPASEHNWNSSSQFTLPTLTLPSNSWKDHMTNVLPSAENRGLHVITKNRWPKIKYLQTHLNQSIFILP